MQAPPSKEELLKKLSDPVAAAKEMTDKLFGDLDSGNTGFITKEAYLQKSLEISKMGPPKPEPTEEQKAEFRKLVDANTTDGKISKDGLVKILTEVNKKIYEHIKNSA